MPTILKNFDDTVMTDKLGRGVSPHLRIMQVIKDTLHADNMQVAHGIYKAARKQ